MPNFVRRNRCIMMPDGAQTKMITVKWKELNWKMKEIKREKEKEDATKFETKNIYLFFFFK